MAVLDLSPCSTLNCPWTLAARLFGAVFWKVPVTVAGRLRPPLSTAHLPLFPEGVREGGKAPWGAAPPWRNDCSPLLATYRNVMGGQ